MIGNNRSKNEEHQKVECEVSVILNVGDDLPDHHPGLDAAIELVYRVLEAPDLLRGDTGRVSLRDLCPRLRLRFRIRILHDLFVMQ